MSNQDDEFADVRDAVGSMGYGTLGGAGADHHDEVKTRLAKDGSGVNYQCKCDRCGRTLSVTAPWAELVYMSQGVLPPNQAWVHDQRNGVFMPNPQQGCPHCGDRIRLGVTPDECTRWLKSGVAAGKVNPQQIVGLTQQIAGRGGR